MPMRRMAAGPRSGVSNEMGMEWAVRGAAAVKAAPDPDGRRPVPLGRTRGRVAVSGRCGLRPRAKEPRGPPAITLAWDAMCRHVARATLKGRRRVVHSLVRREIGRAHP